MKVDDNNHAPVINTAGKNLPKQANNMKQLGAEWCRSMEKVHLRAK